MVDTEPKTTQNTDSVESNTVPTTPMLTTEQQEVFKSNLTEVLGNGDKSPADRLRDVIKAVAER